MLRYATPQIFKLFGVSSKKIEAPRSKLRGILPVGNKPDFIALANTGTGGTASRGEYARI
jgi:hypothetical protein